MKPTGFALVAVCALLAAAGVQAQQTGGIRGSVYDYEAEVPLAGVRVTVVEPGIRVETGADGNFVVPDLPTGTYSVTFVLAGYEREVRTGVIVTPGRLTDLRIDLAMEVYDMAEMVVTGQDLLGSSEIGLINIRAQAIELQDAISSELIGKAGVGDVAGAIKLVTGVSVADGKYATVRGLSDRYTGTTLNGVRVPSADPRRRAVQVDLFPTGTVENVTVTKTFTPNLQGDFTGGGVDIQTKSIPDEFILSIGTSLEHNSLATGEENFLTYEGGGLNSTGFAGDERQLPQLVQATTEFPTLPNPAVNPSEASIEAAQFYDSYTRSFAPVMGVSRADDTDDNQGFSLVAGNRFALGEKGGVFGLIGSLTYAHKYDFYDGATNNRGTKSGPDNEIGIVTPRTDAQGKEEILEGLLLNAVYQLNPQHEYSLRWIANHSAEDTARFQVQPVGETTVDQNQALRYSERTVESRQLHGKDTFPGVMKNFVGDAWSDIEIDWTLSANSTLQEEPDQRFFRNIYDTESFSSTRPPNITDPDVTRRIFREIEEENEQGLVHFTFPFRQWNDREGKLRAGLYLEETDRTFRQQSFVYTFPSQLGNAFFNPIVQRNQGYQGFQADAPGVLWTDVFLDPERIGLSSDPCVAPQNPFTFGAACASPNQLLWTIRRSQQDVDYDGEQTISAHYWMVELPLSPRRFSLTAGARHETTDIAIEPFNELSGLVKLIVRTSNGAGEVFVPQEDGRAEIRDTALLPSLTLTYDIVENMRLRAAWSRTIARPTFRELAPVATEEYLAGDQFVGNPELQLSDIENYDLRWEWFRRPGEVLAASIFEKDIENPIELLSFTTGNQAYIQPVNYEMGRLEGWEVEARTALDIVWDRLAGVQIGANYASLDTSVDVPEEEQASLAAYGLDQETRSLQGQPEYLFNANLTWDWARAGLSLGIFWNDTGETLLTGAARGPTDGNPNVFQARRSTLDAKITKDFKRAGWPTFSVSLKGNNLTEAEIEEFYRGPDGQEVLKVLRPGAMRISLSGSARW